MDEDTVMLSSIIILSIISPLPNNWVPIQTEETTYLFSLSSTMDRLAFNNPDANQSANNGILGDAATVTAVKYKSNLRILRPHFSINLRIFCLSFFKGEIFKLNVKFSLRSSFKHGMLKI